MSRRRCAATLRAVVIVTLVHLALVGEASASGFSLSATRFEATFRGLTLRGVEGGSLFEVRCNVTLEGSFESRTFPVDRGPLEVGVIDSATMTGCSAAGARVSFLTETLPWSITFASYSGTLPTISSIDFELRGLRILVEAPPFMACLYRSTQATPATYRWELEAGVVTNERMVEEATIDRLSTLFRESLLICPGALELAGTKQPPVPERINFSLI